jgi:hypothetical protein
MFQTASAKITHDGLPCTSVVLGPDLLNDASASSRTALLKYVLYGTSLYLLSNKQKSCMALSTVLAVLDAATRVSDLLCEICVGTYNRLSAQMSSGQDKAVICPNKRCDRVSPVQIPLGCSI